MVIAKTMVFCLAFATGLAGGSIVSYSLTPHEVPTHTRESLEHPGSATRGSGFASFGFRRDPLNETLPGDEVKSRTEPATDSEGLKGPKVVTPLKIISKQKAEYTAEARSTGIQGTVTLRVTFLASGGIGSITTVRGLPFGLTEQAIEAARKIEFEAEKVDGVPRTTARPVTFTFNIY